MVNEEFIIAVGESLCGEYGYIDDDAFRKYTSLYIRYLEAFIEKYNIHCGELLDVKEIFFKADTLDFYVDFVEYCTWLLPELCNKANITMEQLDFSMGEDEEYINGITDYIKETYPKEISSYLLEEVETFTSFEYCDVYIFIEKDFEFKKDMYKIKNQKDFEEYENSPMVLNLYNMYKEGTLENGDKFYIQTQGSSGCGGVSNASVLNPNFFENRINLLRF